MEIGIVMAPSYLSVNRDGLTPVRLAQCMVSVPTDLRVIQLIGNTDDSPVVGSKILILPVESAWECGMTLESILPSLLTLIGDKVIAASTAVGVPSPLSQISLRAIPNATGGQIELGGITDWVVAFTDMKIAFDSLKATVQANYTAYTAHKHTGVTTGPGSSGTTDTPGTAPTADMTAAKVTTVQVP